MTNVLEIKDLQIDFAVHGGTVRAVDGLSLRVPRGKTVALVGESGSGKSVTAQAIMGILPGVGSITGGSILLNDPRNDGPPVDIAAIKPDSPAMRSIRGRQISIIFQEPMTSLSPLHTVGNQIGEALSLHRDVTPAQAREMCAEMLGLVGFPDPVRALDTYPFELSGGLRQRAMIAMALVCRPALLIADEPTTALDVTIQAQILKLIRDLQRELDMAMLIITHDLGVVANVADEVVVMYHGRLMESGMVEDIYRDPGHPYLKALLQAVPRFHMEPGERLTPLREIKPTTGHVTHREDGDAKPVTREESARPLLEVSGLNKTFSIRKESFFGAGKSTRVAAVSDVSFTVERGECLGLVGESGCGKSTTSKIIMRALSPDSGTVTFDDRGTAVELMDLNEKQLFDYRKRIQYVFQDPFSALNPRMTVLDILSEPLTIHQVGDERHKREVVRELMALVGLDERFLNRYPHSFSGGQRQRIGIARALALKPELLLCDEPVSALDVSVQAQILNLLKDLQSELGLTYLFISHNLAVVDYMADRIAVMCAGRIVEVAPSEMLFRNPLHPYTRALVAAVPEPDINYPLDFQKIMDGRTSDPSNWPEPYRLTEGERPELIEAETGHFVLTSGPAAATDLERVA